MNITTLINQLMRSPSPAGNSYLHNVDHHVMKTLTWYKNQPAIFKLRYCHSLLKSQYINLLIKMTIY